jgi:hypothetical protein
MKQSRRRIARRNYAQKRDYLWLTMLDYMSTGHGYYLLGIGYSAYINRTWTRVALRIRIFAFAMNDIHKPCSLSAH